MSCIDTIAHYSFLGCFYQVGQGREELQTQRLAQCFGLQPSGVFVKSVSHAAELNKLLVECNFPSICIYFGMSQEEW